MPCVNLFETENRFYQMKSLFLSLAMVAALATQVNGQTNSSAPVKEFKLITTIESVVPGGLGRSRMISEDSTGKLEEKEMENFFSLVGINFKNVKENNVTIKNKLNEIAAQGWTLQDVTSGVYSSAESTGIFITRYIFSRNKR